MNTELYDEFKKGNFEPLSKYISTHGRNRIISFTQLVRKVMSFTPTPTVGHQGDCHSSSPTRIDRIGTEQTGISTVFHQV